MESADGRITRIEKDVVGLREAIGVLTRGFDTVQSDVKSLGNILGRIETGVARAQEKSEERSERNKPNLTAIVSVLITIISILVGGAWLIAGRLATLDERTMQRARELDQIHSALERMDQRTWDLRQDRRPVAP